MNEIPLGVHSWIITMGNTAVGNDDLPHPVGITGQGTYLEPLYGGQERQGQAERGAGVQLPQLSS